jgi:predicted nucleic acid-binding protein
MRLALIDTGAIFAIANRNEMRHAVALEAARSWLAARNEFVLLDWVFDEAMTLLKARLGSAAALHTGRDLRHNPVYHWVPVTPDDEREVWSVFQQYADKDWSYTDCALLVLSRRLKVKQVFSYDGHIAQMPGVKRVG